MNSFTIDNNHFLLNGKPFRILAGAMHYFRVVPEYWEDRLLKLRSLGLNTLETYVSWNLHEPNPGEYDFEGILNLVDYINRAANAGLQVIVRPAPYICSEWDLGGLPPWLLKDPGMRMRCSYKPYLDAVDRFYDVLMAKLEPLQITKGGPIIAMQVENEYGSYGNDKTYLQYLVDGMTSRGIEIPLFTSDGALDSMLQSGTLPNILKTVNFGLDPDAAFRKLREYQPQGPLMCAEFWCGGYDHWGDEPSAREPGETAATVNSLLAAGASLSLYMFHGGTNFGFMNGANHKELYQPTATTYDTDAPLNEAGDVTPKFLAIREVIGKYAPVPDMPIPEASPKMALGPVTLTESVGLFDALDDLASPVRLPTPEPMEMLGQNYGFILYRANIPGPRDEEELTIRDIHDRAHVFIDGILLGIIERERPGEPLAFKIPAEGITLEILVENMGRINYGPEMHDRKGITEGVRFGKQYVFDWENYPLPLESLSALKFSAIQPWSGPAFYRGVFTVKDPRDSFLALPGWSKGVCWLNGFNLGRYWERGPQKTLYVPAPLFREEANELILLELDGRKEPAVGFQDYADLGG